MTWILRFEILEWWHAGSGLTAGGKGGAAVSRGPDGLPWLPGRTVRGLVREALVEAAALKHPEVPSDLAPWLCGGDDDTDDLRRRRFNSEPGHGTFGSAELPEDWRRWARSPAGRVLVAELFGSLAATAIQDGAAKEHSLRSMEVTAPMTLEAILRVEGTPPADPQAALAAALPLLRGLGAGRHRGLGRVRVTVRETRA
ncbi:MAG: hypothetical protein HQL40_03970 [Alphaproteobacteria bacterium]|nr:hypothetical protein [Alphaproteobacteria bacterium]